MSDFKIRPTLPADKHWIERFIVERWSSSSVVVHGTEYYPHELPGFVAMLSSLAVGLVTYHIVGKACEIVTLDSKRPGIGIGTALLASVIEASKKAGCKRLWLVTTNDNLNALGFYQKQNFVLVKIHRNAVDNARRLKPSIPLFGIDGIPIRDEIELEMQLNDDANTL